jgi:hypothetical protein
LADIQTARENFYLKKLGGHSSLISAFLSSAHGAGEVRQYAVVSGHESKPILFSPLLFVQQSRRYLGQLVLGSGPGDIVIDSTFDWDSVVQFMAAYEGADF